MLLVIYLCPNVPVLSAVIWGIRRIRPHGSCSISTPEYHGIDPTQCRFTPLGYHRSTITESDRPRVINSGHSSPGSYGPTKHSTGRSENTQGMTDDVDAAREHIRADPFCGTLGIDFATIEPGYAETTLTVTEDVVNFNGKLHGR